MYKHIVFSISNISFQVVKFQSLQPKKESMRKENFDNKKR